MRRGPCAIVMRRGFPRGIRSVNRERPSGFVERRGGEIVEPVGREGAPQVDGFAARTAERDEDVVGGHRRAVPSGVWKTQATARHQGATRRVANDQADREAAGSIAGCSVSPIVLATRWRPSYAAAVRWNPDVRLRLARTGRELRAQLAEAPEPGDETIDVGSITVFVEPGVEGVVDAGEHNVLTIAPGLSDGHAVMRASSSSERLGNLDGELAELTAVPLRPDVRRVVRQAGRRRHHRGGRSPDEGRHGGAAGRHAHRCCPRAREDRGRDLRAVRPMRRPDPRGAARGAAVVRAVRAVRLPPVGPSGDVAPRRLRAVVPDRQDAVGHGRDTAGGGRAARRC